MKKNKIRNTFIALIILVGIVSFLQINCVYADFISDAQNWYNKGGDATELDSGVMSGLAKDVERAGTAIISIATIVLGIKYVIGSATGKAEVKQQLIGLFVACLLFFGWSNLSSLLIQGATYDEATGTYSGISGATQLFIFDGVTTVSGIFQKVFAIVLFFGKIAALIATMYIGVKYIISGSQGRSELKQKGPMYIIGILMIFCTLNILSFISDAINQATAL